jgi:hypothetical protein
MEMKSYITGSRVYGYPREDSDIDLVVALSDADYRSLWAWKVSENPSVKPKLMYGNLNLVAFNVDWPDDLARFHKWKAVHDVLCTQAPVTKEFAIEAFRAGGAEGNYNGDQVVNEEKKPDVKDNDIPF